MIGKNTLPERKTIEVPNFVRNSFFTKRTSYSCVGESLTQQQFKDDVNVNSIVERFLKTGNLPVLDGTEPNYGFAEAIEFKQAMDLVTDAQQKFDELPSEIRQKFNSDPKIFLEAIGDPNHREMFQEMGVKFVESGQPAPAAAPEPTNQQPKGGRKAAEAAPDVGETTE